MTSFIYKLTSLYIFDEFPEPDWLFSSGKRNSGELTVSIVQKKKKRKEKKRKARENIKFKLQNSGPSSGPLPPAVIQRAIQRPISCRENEEEGPLTSSASHRR